MQPVQAALEEAFKEQHQQQPWGDVDAEDAGFAGTGFTGLFLDGSLSHEDVMRPALARDAEAEADAAGSSQHRRRNLVDTSSSTSLPASTVVGVPEAYSPAPDYWTRRPRCGIFNQITGLPTSVIRVDMLQLQSSYFMTRSQFEASPYLKHNRLTVLCTVTVRKKPHVLTTKPVNQIKVPPSDITEHFGSLLDAEEGADVTCSVGGENFRA
ncbi:hypothetical protein EJB05_08993, partial [Eragrostis curvula]